MAAFADELVERLDVEPECEAIEVAAGSGALTLTLAEHVGSLVAVDFAPGMVEILDARLADAGIDNVRCDVMDGQALDVPAARFDRAACSFALMLFPDRAAGFSELARVLRPGGRALVTGWTGPERFESFGLFMEGIQRAFPDMPPPPHPPAVFSLAEPARFKTEMEAAGFKDVEVELTTRDLALDDAEHMWSLLTAGAPPVQELLDRIGEAGAEKLRDTLSDLVDERYGGGPFELANTATVGVGSVD